MLALAASQATSADCWRVKDSLVFTDESPVFFDLAMVKVFAVSCGTYARSVIWVHQGYVIRAKGMGIGRGATASFDCHYCCELHHR